MAFTAAILAVGTEITEGDVVNRNASWIANWISDCGGLVGEHRAVPDDRALLKKSMGEFAGAFDLVVVTGGLGPTTDDFTRYVFAEVMGLPLVFSESSWTRLCERLQGRGVPIRGGHRRECEFPDGARELANTVGTASGFLFEQNGKVPTIWVFLPGPPHEMRAVLREQAWPEVQKLRPAWDNSRLRVVARWFGIPESEVAEAAESILQAPNRSLGYRAHFPFVDVKVWADSERDMALIWEETERLRERLATQGNGLAKWVGFNPTDAAATICEWGLSQEGLTSIVVDDGVTDEWLAYRLISQLVEARVSRRDSTLRVAIPVVEDRSAKGQTSNLSTESTFIIRLALQGIGDVVLLEWSGAGGRSGAARLDLTQVKRRRGEFAAEWALWQIAEGLGR